MLIITIKKFSNLIGYRQPRFVMVIGLSGVQFREYNRASNFKSAERSSDFANHWYDYRPNWTPLSPITIINSQNTLTYERKISFTYKDSTLYLQKVYM